MTTNISEADAVARGLKEYYGKYVFPIEKHYKFDKFATPFLTEADFMAKPQVLMCGQYSVGKTTFIRFILERDFPGCRIGPEPTTDKFAAIMYGKNERLIPGNAAAVQADKPFRALETFGMAFLNRFEVSECASPLLEHITLIDSPGVLAGEKQRLNRGYDFPSVVRYWANRADRILLLFDAHKLDISDEFRNTILALKGNSDKIRCVLNKADQVNTQQIMRVYGALLWSLGKVVQTPEVLRVYIGSFWDQPYEYDELGALFDKERADLLSDLKGLPRHAAIRKVNEFVKRARRAKVHALIMDHLRAQFGWTGKEKKQKKLLADMAGQFRQVSQKHNVPMGDFPNPSKFADILKNFKIYEFPQLKEKHIHALEQVLAAGVPRLLERVSTLIAQQEAASGVGKNNPFAANPFAEDNDATLEMGRGGWGINMTQKSVYDQKFYSLQLDQGFVGGMQVKGVMMSSGLANDKLGVIWGLADIDQDGKMDSDEFAVCMYLIDFVKAGNELPERLPLEICPPSKRPLLSKS